MTTWLAMRHHLAETDGWPLRAAGIVTGVRRVRAVPSCGDGWAIQWAPIIQAIPDDIPLIIMNGDRSLKKRRPQLLFWCVSVIVIIILFIRETEGYYCVIIVGEIEYCYSCWSYYLFEDWWYVLVYSVTDWWGAVAIDNMKILRIDEMTLTSVLCVKVLLSYCIIDLYSMWKMVGGGKHYYCVLFNGDDYSMVLSIWRWSLLFGWRKLMNIIIEAVKKIVWYCWRWYSKTQLVLKEKQACWRLKEGYWNDIILLWKKWAILFIVDVLFRNNQVLCVLLRRYYLLLTMILKAFCYLPSVQSTIVMILFWYLYLFPLFHCCGIVIRYWAYYCLIPWRWKRLMVRFLTVLMGQWYLFELLLKTDYCQLVVWGWWEAGKGNWYWGWAVGRQRYEWLYSVADTFTLRKVLFQNYDSEKTYWHYWEAIPRTIICCGC